MVAPPGSLVLREKDFYKQYPPYQPGDTLYVRETWGFQECRNRANYGMTEDDSFPASMHKWHPSIHLPKEAARIWLKVTDVRVERLKDITEEQAIKEGTPYDLCGGWRPSFYDPDSGGDDPDFIRGFSRLWDSTIKKQDLDHCGWIANPWVWRIEFERCEKPGQ